MHAPRRTPLVIAHRGASGYRPEHSEAAYRLAFELGADFAEPDIVATKDGVLVVRHENEISGTTDVADHAEFAARRTTKVVDGAKLTGWFTEDFTWEELATLRCRERLAKTRPENTAFDLQEPVLRLVDVLSLIDAAGERHGRALGAVVEIKHAQYFLELGHDLGAMLLRDLAAAGWNDRREQLVIESFELGVLDRLRAAQVAASLVFLTEDAGSPADEPVSGAPARSFAWYRSDAGLDLLAGRVEGISVAKSDLLKTHLSGRVTPTDLVQRAHQRGLRVFTWTLRPENRFLTKRFQSSRHAAEHGDWQREFALVLASGVDGIFVDHPDYGVAAREAWLGGA